MATTPHATTDRSAAGRPASMARRAVAHRAVVRRPSVRRAVAHRPPPVDDLGRDLALPVGAAVTAMVVTALLVTGQAAHLSFSLAAFALLTVAVAAPARPLLVPAVILVSWMFFDGFVVHQHAELGWQQADRNSFYVLAGAGLAGAGCAAVARALRRRTARRGA